jgi:SAM-dependent methyltransferase
MASTSSYDEIAGMYHALWADWYLPAAMPALERLFFSRVPPSARVLDLCCGSGHVTKELVKRGYNVTGIDASAELIALARKDLPGIDLRVQDARNLRLELQFDAVLSTFDSLNHVLSLNELEQVFAGIYRLLGPSGVFVFDMNLEEAYSADLHEWAVDVNGESVGLVRGTYDPMSQKAFTELIWFVRTGQDNLWRQHTSVVEQRCYQQLEILSSAHNAGFNHIEAVAAKDAGVTSQLGYGRIYFVAARHE